MKPLLRKLAGALFCSGAVFVPLQGGGEQLEPPAVIAVTTVPKRGIKWADYTGQPAAMQSETSVSTGTADGAAR